MYRPRMRRYVQPMDPIANQRQWQDGDDPTAEYIELWHRGTSPLDLSQWQLIDDRGVVARIPQGTQVLPGEFLVLAKSAQALHDHFGASVRVAAEFEPGASLSDQGERLALVDGLGRIVDLIQFEDAGDWPTAPDQLGTSLERISAADAARDPAHWRASHAPRPQEPARPAVGTEFFITRGTPGAPNSVAASSLPPFVPRSSIVHHPLRPRSTDIVTVTAVVESMAAVAQVMLQVDSLVSPYQTPSSESLPMYDDGTHGDRVAGDGEFTAQLAARSSQTLVRYRVEVADVQGAVASYPDAIEPNPNQAFYVYDGEAETQLQSFFLIVPTATQRALDANIWNSELLDATIVIDGIVHDHIGIHYRGRGWRVHPKKSYSVAFNKGEYYRGMSRLDLAMHFPTMQNLVHNIFAAVGVEPLGSEVVRLYRNGKFYGLMLAQEYPNSSWLEAHGLDGDGEIFKASAAPNFTASGFSGDLMADLDHFEDPSVYPRLYEKKGDAFGSYASIIELTDIIANTPDDQLVEKLQQTIELDQWLTTWALQVVGGNGDIIGTNFTLIKPAESGSRWQLRSFDFSHFFGCQALDFVDVICNPYTQDPYRYFNHFHYRVMKNDSLRERFLVILRDMLENQLTAERMNQWIDRTFQDYEIDRLDEVALNIPGPPTHYVVYGSDQQEIKEYHAKRRQWLLETWIPSQGFKAPSNEHPTIRLEQPTYGGDDTTIRWSAHDLEGDAASVDLYWSDGNWLHFQPIPNAQNLDASAGAFLWHQPPGVVNQEIVVQAVIRDQASDLVGRDMSQVAAPPAAPTIDIVPGATATITLGAAGANETIYYTVDGSDPRGHDNQPSATAIRYHGSLTLSENGFVKARTRRAKIGAVGDDWSELAQQFVVVDVPNLVISEIMYNPEGASDYEYIEFFNAGDKAIRLRDVLVDSRTSLFDFGQSPLEFLAPHQYTVLVRNATKFRERYPGNEIAIAGTFSQSLSNSTQDLRLTMRTIVDPFLSIRYQDTWEPTTDGGGYALVVRDPYASATIWNVAEGWRASVNKGGSPGHADVEDFDLNDDLQMTIDDLDALALRLRADDLRVDFSEDGVANRDDLLVVVTNAFHTVAGDANLDGRFDSSDLVRIFQSQRYEDAIVLNATWSTGDWDGDGEFTTSDLVWAFQLGGYA